jgi:hypothetical protein
MCQSQTILFGDLLVQLQLLSAEDLHNALQVAPQFGLPLGRTLVLSGLLSEAELQLAVELQPLINQRKYPLESARKAAELVRSGVATPQEALKRVGASAAPDKTTLGSLLIEAGAISQEQLDEAQRAAYQTGMRLGRMLILNGAITHALLTRALGLQSMVREKRISLEQAVEMLSDELPRREKERLPLSLEAHQMRLAPAKKQVRFGEFLVLAGLATEAEMLNAMEMSLTRECSLGEAIVALGLVSRAVFDRAVNLHEKVCRGETPLAQATDDIHRMVFGDPVQLASAPPSPVLGELLKMTGFVNDSDILEAIQLSNKYPSLIGKMLVISGAIDEATLISSLRCQYLLKHGYIRIDDAVQALQYAQKNKVSFDEALEELGFRKPPVP